MRLVPAAIVVVMVGAATASARRVVEKGANAGDIPYLTDLTAAVTSVAADGGEFHLGDVKVTVPADLSRLPWRGDEPDWDVVDLEEPVAAGDLVGVWGSLRPDGSILAYAVWHPSQPREDAFLVGVVESVTGTWDDQGFWDATGFTVGGRTLRVTWDLGGTDFDLGLDTNHEVRPVLPGDLVCATYRDDGDGGDEGLAALSVTVRPAGEGTVLEGSATVLDSGFTFDLGGVTVYEDSTTTRAGDASLRTQGNFEVRTGHRLRVRGLLRDGMVIARQIEFLAFDPPSAAKRRGRVRAHGVVESLRPDGLTLSGLGVAPRSRGVRALRRIAPGDLVRADGIVRGGVVVASRLRRR